MLSHEATKLFSEHSNVCVQLLGAHEFEKNSNCQIFAGHLTVEIGGEAGFGHAFQIET